MGRTATSCGSEDGAVQAARAEDPAAVESPMADDAADIAGEAAAEEEWSPPAALSRQRRGGVRRNPERSALETYFRDMSRHALLTADGERECARRIRELEVAQWAQLLSYPPILPHVVDHLRVPLDGASFPKGGQLLRLARSCWGCGAIPLARVQQAFRSIAKQAGSDLREMDRDHALLDAATDFVTSVAARDFSCPSGCRRLARSRRFERYLAAVLAAARAVARQKELLVAANLRLVVHIAGPY